MISLKSPQNRKKFEFSIFGPRKTAKSPTEPFCRPPRQGLLGSNSGQGCSAPSGALLGVSTPLGDHFRSPHVSFDLPSISRFFHFFDFNPRFWPKMAPSAGVPLFRPRRGGYQAPIRAPGVLGPWGSHRVLVPPGDIILGPRIIPGISPQNRKIFKIFDFRTP